MRHGGYVSALYFSSGQDTGNDGKAGIIVRETRCPDTLLEAAHDDCSLCIGLAWRSVTAIPRAE
jgi:hypothetical protein